MNELIINLKSAEKALSREELHILSVLNNKVKTFEVEQEEIKEIEEALATTNTIVSLLEKEKLKYVIPIAESFPDILGDTIGIKVIALSPEMFGIPNVTKGFKF